MADIEADLIIVGSGISGALLAAKLSAAGVKVAILEAGARINRGEATKRFWDAPIRVPECPYPPTPEANHPISNDPDYWYRQTGPNKFKSTYLKVVVCAGSRWKAFRGSRDAASPQFGEWQRASCLLRQRKLHPGVPDRREIRRDVHLSLAEKHGAVVHAETTATRIEVGAEGRVTAIHFKRWDGSESVATGKIFVLAAHAIETPRLLLHSRSEALPNGVANSSDQVGRNLMDHPTQLSWALATEPVWPYRGPLSTSSIENFRDGSFRKDRPAMRIEIGNDGWAWPKGAPVTTAADFAMQGLRGRALDSALRDQASRHLRLASQVEQLPDAENRVTLDPDEKDIYGVPLPRLAFRLDAYVEAGLAAARAAHAEIFNRVGATEIQHRDAPEGAGHIMGTARMGNDPKDSVVDRDLLSHDHRNLFILGSAVFPTGATANPTLTIAALSLRAAERVKAALTG